MRFFVLCISLLTVFANCISSVPSDKDILLKFENYHRYSKNVSKILITDLPERSKETKIIKHIIENGVRNNFAYMTNVALSGYDKVKFTNKAEYNFWDFDKKLRTHKYFIGTEESINVLQSGKEYSYWFKERPKQIDVGPLYFYLSDDIINNYSNYKYINKYGNSWHVYSGKTDESKASYFTLKIVDEFEIWISEDFKTWMEFYKNKKGELRIAAEGLFTDTDVNSVIKNPKSASELHENILKTYHNTYIFRNNILKGTVLGEGL